MSDVVLLVNPAAGRGRGRSAATAAERRLRDAGYAVRTLVADGPDGTRRHAETSVADGVPTLVVVGGDGTVHQAVQALGGSGTRLGVVPVGTGNDLARHLGLPRRDPTAAADVVVASRTRRIDLIRAGPRYVVTVLAAGFDAVVNERAARMRRPSGSLRYTLAALAELRHLAPVRYDLSLDGEPLSLEATLVAVGNGPSYGGGLRITEGAELDDGQLDVVVVRPMGRRRLLRAYPTLYRGTVGRLPEYLHRRVRQVTVAAQGVVAYADGERIGPLPLTAEVAPGALEVLVP